LGNAISFDKKNAGQAPARPDAAQVSIVLQVVLQLECVEYRSTDAFSSF
jgi:hypothetical protein